MDAFLIEDFDAKNIEDILEIQEEAFSGIWTRKMFFEEHEHAFSHFKICKTGGRIAGFIIYRIIENEGEILNIVVKKDLRRQSAGVRLLNFALNDMKEKKIKAVFLEVDERNAAAAALYGKTGFTVYGVRKSYYGTGNAVLMRLNL